mmetsp:Transcript_27881/g.56186  ORF Transcript_27881/g.56186 Transcript_27881/m.56186 type:complete len:237 (+) Transcript_27881:254-964(+)
MWVETWRASSVVLSTNTGTASTPSARSANVSPPQKEEKPNDDSDDSDDDDEGGAGAADINDEVVGSGSATCEETVVADDERRCGGGGVCGAAMPRTMASNSGNATELERISAWVVCKGRTNTTPTFTWCLAGSRSSSRSSFLVAAGMTKCALVRTSRAPPPLLLLLLLPLSPPLKLTPPSAVGCCCCCFALKSACGTASGGVGGAGNRPQLASIVFGNGGFAMHRKGGAYGESIVA